VDTESVRTLTACRKTANPPARQEDGDGTKKTDRRDGETYRGTVSLPFEPGKHKRIAVKIVDDRGIESLKVMEVE
jgi:hypothetical protein